MGANVYISYISYNRWVSCKKNYDKYITNRSVLTHVRYPFITREKNV